MTKTKILLFILVGVFCWGQTKIKTQQIERITKDGVVVQTEEGLKTAFPLSGFIYPIGGTQAQLMTDGSKKIIMSEIPKLQEDGTYLLRYRPNPAIIAVYRNGLRLSPEIHYSLIWINKDELPDRFSINNSNSSDNIVVDYVVGSTELLQEALIK